MKGQIIVARLPRRKRPVLVHANEGVWTPLAYFVSDEAARQFTATMEFSTKKLGSTAEFAPFLTWKEPSDE